MDSCCNNVNIVMLKINTQLPVYLRFGSTHIFFTLHTHPHIGIIMLMCVWMLLKCCYVVDIFILFVYVCCWYVHFWYVICVCYWSFMLIIACCWLCVNIFHVVDYVWYWYVCIVICCVTRVSCWLRVLLI